MRVGSAAHVRVEGFTCVSRGLRTYSGVYAHTQGLTCERTMWLSGRYHPGQAPDNVLEQPIPPRTAQNADHFATSSPFSAFFTEVVCVLGATLPRTAAAPPPIWGNCAMQGCDTPATRRQKALHGAKPPPPPVASALQGGGRAWLRRPWAAAGPGRASRRGLAAASVGGGGARRRCWSAAAGPGRASRSTTPSEARVWRSRGRAAADQHTQRPGPSKQAKRRSKTSRALRRPEHPWDHKQPGPAGNATKSSPSEPCARAGASRPGRNGCGPRCAAPRLRCR